MKHLLFVFAFISLLTGCALNASSTEQFSNEPVPNRDMVIYTCTGAQEEFENHRPMLNNLQLMSRSVTVVDIGTNWVATWDGGKLESPVLYKDVLGKVDGNVNLDTGERFYRINNVMNDNPTFSYSNVNQTTGSGNGMTFFRCTSGVIDETPTPMILVPSDEEK